MKVNKTLGTWMCELCSKNKARLQIVGKDVPNFTICIECIDEIYKARAEETEKEDWYVL